MANLIILVECLPNLLNILKNHKNIKKGRRDLNPMLYVVKHITLVHFSKTLFIPQRLTRCGSLFHKTLLPPSTQRQQFKFPFPFSTRAQQTKGLFKVSLDTIKNGKHFMLTILDLCSHQTQKVSHLHPVAVDRMQMTILQIGSSEVA